MPKQLVEINIERKRENTQLSEKRGEKEKTSQFVKKRKKIKKDL
jgi:hypothetical protein